jgi:hypothetical protein
MIGVPFGTNSARRDLAGVAGAQHLTHQRSILTLEVTSGASNVRYAVGDMDEWGAELSDMAAKQGPSCSEQYKCIRY